MKFGKVTATLDVILGHADLSNSDEAETSALEALLVLTRINIVYSILVRDLSTIDVQAILLMTHA